MYRVVWSDMTAQLMFINRYELTIIPGARLSFKMRKRDTTCGHKQPSGYFYCQIRFIKRFYSGNK